MNREDIVPINLEDAQQNERCFVVGCFIKKGDNYIDRLITTIDERELKVKPKVKDEIDILIEYNELYFQDSQQEDVTLTGNIKGYERLSGLTVGIYGIPFNNHRFYVESVVHPLMPPYIERPLLEEDVYIIILSGLNFFKTCPTILRQLNHFCDILNSEKYYNKIARMVIAGNNFDTECFCEDCQGTRLQDIGYDEETLALRTSNTLKRFFPHIDIDVMPGDTDLSSATFPQQPLHKSLFESYKRPTLKELEKDEERIDRMKYRKRKRRQDESDNDEIKIIKEVVGGTVVHQEEDVGRIINAQATNGQNLEDKFGGAEDIAANFDDDIPVVTASPSASEKKYSLIFSQETITLTDNSVNVKKTKAINRYYKETYNEEYGIAVDNWLLGRVGRDPNFQRQITPVTNPYCFKVMGVEIHGTSGQNVDSLKRVKQSGNETLYFLHAIIQCGHIFPTAPDYLDLLPNPCKDGKDPVALDQLPHIFFAANQKKFATELVDYGNNQKVRLIAIPKYVETETMVVVNLRTLQTSQIIPHRRI
uniref:DNA polymerase alpha/delta/epsilon subunit B domain-containing protein n=1 Tax=Panagrolaimus superbus TaxID=310955 RepID=A0A914Z5M3_9BILA